MSAAAEGVTPCTGPFDEGDMCPDSQCDGRLSTKPTENCSCHISPPCSACLDAPLICDACAMEIDPNG